MWSIDGYCLCRKICYSIENFAGLSLQSSFQHADWSITRFERDVEKLYMWLQDRKPFSFGPHIVSLSTGITGDDKYDCYKAFNVGRDLMKNCIGQNFADVKFKRSKTVKSLASMSYKVKVRDEEKVLTDPLLLFQRISLLKESSDQLREYFNYELSPFPLSLFDIVGMRKTVKSSL